VMILDGKVFIDGELLAEPYATGPTASGRENAWELRAGEVFVLGDNRAYSNDSRSFGPVTIDRIVGKVFFVLTPDSMQLVPTVSYPTPATTP
jgi:signal peptidase I